MNAIHPHIDIERRNRFQIERLTELNFALGAIASYSPLFCFVLFDVSLYPMKQTFLMLTAFYASSTLPWLVSTSNVCCACMSYTPIRFKLNEWALHAPRIFLIYTRKVIILRSPLSFSCCTPHATNYGYSCRRPKRCKQLYSIITNTANHKISQINRPNM